MLDCHEGQAETELVQIPSNISTEEAASIPLGLATAAIAMYNESGGLELTEPWTTEGKNKYAGKPFVVCAASTSVGQFGACTQVGMTKHTLSSRARLSVLQFAKLSGFSPIIATASPANFSLVKTLGATHVVDRKLLGSLGEEVAKITTEPIQYAYDAWGDAQTQQALHDILAPRGRLVIVNPKQIEERDGKTLFQVFGYVQVEGNRKVGASLFGALERLLSEGIIKVPYPSY
jgi:NADPH:quinone reductase-like Zn-dependent oxidoreductase